MANRVVIDCDAGVDDVRWRHLLHGGEELRPGPRAGPDPHVVDAVEPRADVELAEEGNVDTVAVQLVDEGRGSLLLLGPLRAGLGAVGGDADVVELRRVARPRADPAQRLGRRHPHRLMIGPQTGDENRHGRSCLLAPARQELRRLKTLI